MTESCNLDTENVFVRDVQLWLLPLKSLNQLPRQVANPGRERERGDNVTWLSCDWRDDAHDFATRGGKIPGLIILRRCVNSHRLEWAIFYKGRLVLTQWSARIGCETHLGIRSTHHLCERTKRSNSRCMLLMLVAPANLCCNNHLII